MESKRDGPLPEATSCRSMMQQMMERMCGTAERSPAAMCERMMAAMKTTKDTDAQGTPEPPTPEEQSRGGDDGAGGGC